jgi:uncharacterized membrane protein YsdA (DUF1294 family)
MSGPISLLLWFVTANVVAYLLMLIDKRSAQAGARRIRESTLLSWSLIGGSLGALAASIIVRHKTRKQPIAFLLRAIPVGQAATLAAIWQGWIALP